MNEALVQSLLFLLVILLVEYFVIQPWLRYRESKSLISGQISDQTSEHKWGDGIRKGIKQFKQHANYYNWGGISIKQHFVELEEFNISKGQAEIFLIVNVRYLLDTKRPVGGYRIVIDRIGDISQFETIETRKNPFDNQDIPFPGSWLIVGFLLFVVFTCRLFASIPSGFVVETSNGTPAPVDQWSSLATPVALGASINGTIGGNETDVYSFKTDLSEKVSITVTPIEYFEGFLFIYDENGSRIRNKFIGKVKSSIEIAPEPNLSYLIVVESAKSGGSYVLNISLSSP